MAQTDSLLPKLKRFSLIPFIQWFNSLLSS